MPLCDITHLSKFNEHTADLKWIKSTINIVMGIFRINFIHFQSNWSRVQLSNGMLREFASKRDKRRSVSSKSSTNSIWWAYCHNFKRTYFAKNYCFIVSFWPNPHKMRVYRLNGSKAKTFSIIKEHFCVEPIRKTVMLQCI